MKKTSLLISILIVVILGITFYVTKPFNTPTVIDNEEWSTYIDKEYGFEFKYPKDKFLNPAVEKLNSDISSVRLKYIGSNAEGYLETNGLRKGGLYVGLFKPSEDKVRQLSSWYKSRPDTYKLVNIGGREGFLENDSYWFFQLKDGWYINGITMHVTNMCSPGGFECVFMSRKDSENTEIFNQILSTFKFY